MLGWAKDRIYGPEKSKLSGYLQNLSIGGVEDMMAGDINPFVNIEADQKEDRNVTYFGCIKDKMYGQTNKTDYQQNRNAGFWNKIKLEKEYLKIGKYKVKEYMPNIKIVEDTSDVVKTFVELTGFPFLQGIGKITKKCCKLYLLQNDFQKHKLEVYMYIY